MTDGDALLRAICENPRDDLPRLVFADWLDENGQPERAAFIRTEIDVYRRPEWDAERVRYEGRARTDTARLAKLPWAADHLTGHPPGVEWGGSPVVRRGFPWCLRVLRPYHLFGPWAGPSGRHPVERLAFGPDLPDAGLLLGSGWLGRVSGLSFRDVGYPPSALAQVAAAAAAGGVEAVEFWSAALTPAGAERLAETPLLGRLTSLALGANGPRAAQTCLDALARVGPAARLRHLYLGTSQLGDDGLPALAAAAAVLPLEVLELPKGRLTGERAAAVAGMPLGGVRVLKLGGNPVGNAGAAALAGSPHLPNLLVLDLAFCQVGDDGIRAILESPLADRLVLLDLIGSPASAETKQEARARMGDRVRL